MIQWVQIWILKLLTMFFKNVIVISDFPCCSLWFCYSISVCLHCLHFSVKHCYTPNLDTGEISYWFHFWTRMSSVVLEFWKITSISTSFTNSQINLLCHSVNFTKPILHFLSNLLGLVLFFNDNKLILLITWYNLSLLIYILEKFLIGFTFKQGCQVVF